MTRDDLVSYITTKAQMVETDDVAACQSFVSKRYELIYNGYLWKDSLTMVDIAIDPVNNPDNNVGIVVLPAQIDRVVAIRTTTQSMRIHALEEYYRVDWNRFADISDVNGLQEFSILNPLWFTRRPVTGSTLLNTSGLSYLSATPGVITIAVTQGANYIIVPGASEAGGTMVNGTQTAIMVNGTPISIIARSNTLSFILAGNAVPSGSTYNAFTALFVQNLVGNTNYWIAWGGNDASLDNFGGTPNGNIVSTGSGTVSAFTASPTQPLDLHGKAPGLSVTAAIYTASPASAFTASIYAVAPTVVSGANSVAGSSITIQSANADDNAGGKTPQQIKVTWRDTQNRYVTTANMPLTLTPADGLGFIEVESVFKPVTLGNVNATLLSTVNGVTFSSVVGTLLTTDTRSPNLQRVRLFSAPNQTLTLSVLGKKPFVPLDFGSEQPLIRNLDNCLIAFGLADMLQRGRQYGKAQSQMQEATVLLAELAKLETLQAANNQRFIPDSGYGDPFFAPSSNRGLWT